jgi:hypothetical protein
MCFVWKDGGRAMSKLPIPIEGGAELLTNPHPGEILWKEFLKPMGLS